MNLVAIDCETFLLNTSGKATTKTVPRLVCLSVAEDGRESFVLERKRVVYVAKELFERDDVILVGHNVAFDVLVLMRAVQEDLDVDLGPRVFELYSEGRIQDTMIREQLYDIERGGMFRRGGYGLKDLVKRRLSETVKGKSGPDAWRMRYNELDGLPVEKYPEPAYEYALLDAEFTLRVAKNQGEWICNEDFQTTAAFCLDLMSAWGLMIDGEWAAACDAYYAREEAAKLALLVQMRLATPAGKIPVASKKELIANCFLAVGQAAPLTPSGQIATNKKTFGLLESALSKAGYDAGADPQGWLAKFAALQEYNRARKFRSTYLQPMLDAADMGAPLCPRFRVLVDSMRTSSSAPNIQNIVSRLNPREKKLLAEFAELHGRMGALERIAHPDGFVVGPDIRGCIVPREDKVFVGADYSAIEMAGLAQVVLNWGGDSALARSINDHEDQHLRIVAARRGVPYAEVKALYDDYLAAEEEGRAPLDPDIDFDRFAGKSANYGFAGGASAETWVDFCAQMGLEISLPVAMEVRDAWFKAWPEMDFYRNQIQSFETATGEYLCELHGPNRQTRGWATRLAPRFTSAMNTFFQNIVASGCKYTAWLLTRACYLESEGSPLFGARPVIFEHDSFTVECDVDKAQECGEELSRIMVEGMSLFIPDVRIDADFEIRTERWGK